MLEALMPVIIVGIVIAVLTVLLIIGLWVLDRTHRWPIKNSKKSKNSREEKKKEFYYE